MKRVFAACRPKRTGRSSTWISPWIEKFQPQFVKGQWRLVLGAARLALVPFLVGLLAAGLGGYFHLYLRTPAIYIGLAGIGWVAGWGAWADSELQKIQLTIGRAFRAPTQAEDAFRAMMGRLRDPLTTFMWAAPFIALAWAYVAFSTFHRHKLQLFPGWANNSLWGKNVTLDVYGLVITLLLVTMVEGVLRFLRLVHTLAKISLRLPLASSRVLLRPLTRWGLRTGFAWSLALGTIVAFFAPLQSEGSGGQHPSFAAVLVPLVAVLAIAAVWPAALLLGPQFMFHGALCRDRDEFVESTVEQLDRALALGPKNQSSSAAYAKRLATAPVVARYAELVEDGAAQSTWVHVGPGELLLFATQALLPVATLLVGFAVRYK
ncbi:MAG: hypothetical protein E6J20_19340 [Chloroflexi bacterium]|nr:MAG: hypothetical protein E6J20_19340 [Chloroflexota bacterium]